MKPLIFALIALCSSLQAEVWTGTSDVRFKGTSTLHDFEGTVAGVPLEVLVKGEKESRVISASSEVEVKRMSTAEKERDKNMWTMFKATAFQLIKITVPVTNGGKNLSSLANTGASSIMKSPEAITEP